MEVKFIEYGDPVKAVEKGLDKSVNETLAQIATNAKLFAPVATVNGGRLKNSIMYNGPEITGGFNDSGGEKAEKQINSKAKKAVGYIGSNLDYAVYQEFGTRKMAAQPFLRPAIEIQRGKTVASIKKTMNEYMKRFTEQAAKHTKWRERSFTNVKF